MSQRETERASYRGGGWGGRPRLPPPAPRPSRRRGQPLAGTETSCQPRTQVSPCEAQGAPAAHPEKTDKRTGGRAGPGTRHPASDDLCPQPGCPWSPTRSADPSPGRSPAGRAERREGNRGPEGRHLPGSRFPRGPLRGAAERGAGAPPVPGPLRVSPLALRAPGHGTSRGCRESGIPSRSSLSGLRLRGQSPRGRGRPGERAAGEGASRSALPASAALGLRSGGCSSKLRQVSTSSPRGGGRARHREARTASAAWHRGPPDPHTPLMPGTPRHCEQPPEPAPWPHWGGARRPQEDPPRSGPPRLRSAFNHFPAGSPPLTWHPAAAGESGASRPPPLHSGTGLSPSGFEEMAVALPPGGRKAWERAWDAAPRSTAWRDLARASPSLSCFLCQRSVIASASRAAQGHTDSVCENIG